MNKRAIRFSKSVPAGTDLEYTYEINNPCTLVMVHYYMPTGPDGDLELDMYWLTKNGSRMPVFVGDDGGSSDDVISGDNIQDRVSVSIPLHQNSKLCVYANNKDAANNHRFEVIYEIDEMGGEGRVL